MTPLEVLHQKLIEADESGIIAALVRNCVKAVLAFLAFAAFIVVMVLLTTALYWVIGGWAVAIGAVVALGVFVGAIATAFEVL